MNGTPSLPRATDGPTRNFQTPNPAARLAYIEAHFPVRGRVVDPARDGRFIANRERAAELRKAALASRIPGKQGRVLNRETDRRLACNRTPSGLGTDSLPLRTPEFPSKVEIGGSIRTVTIPPPSDGKTVSVPLVGRVG